MCTVGFTQELIETGLWELTKEKQVPYSLEWQKKTAMGGGERVRGLYLT